MYDVNEMRRTAGRLPTAARRAGVSASALIAIVASAVIVSASDAQPPSPGGVSQQPRQERADAAEQLSDRVAALERLVASLDTRVSVVQETTRLPEFGRPVAIRMEDLERRVAQLQLDVQRLQSSVDSAMRTAENAQRSAMQAESTARDALFRASR